MCCECGGGCDCDPALGPDECDCPNPLEPDVDPTPTPDPQPDPQPDPTPTPDPTQCWSNDQYPVPLFDRDGAPWNCGYYDNPINDGNCGIFDDDDFIAAELCCGCGGGCDCDPALSECDCNDTDPQPDPQPDPTPTPPYEIDFILNDINGNGFLYVQELRAWWWNDVCTGTVDCWDMGMLTVDECCQRNVT